MTSRDQEGAPIDSNQERKIEQLRTSLESETSSPLVTTGLSSIQLAHQALPEIDFASIDTSCEILGKRLRLPFIIEAMTGGTAEAVPINRNLARAAQELGIGFGVGSQRAAIEHPELVYTYDVRDVAPDILLLANLGAVQLNYGYGVAECRRAVEMIRADALVLHLNPLHECLQQHGNTNFAGLARRIAAVASALEVPVVAKEVGFGMSGTSAARLREAGVAAIDVGGAGGTSWALIQQRTEYGAARKTMIEAFEGWGIPTAWSIVATRQAAPDLTIIGSGGIRSGVDVAKAIALGADAAGIAAPLLAPATVAASAVVHVVRQYEEALRIAMFATGARTIAELKRVKYVEK